MNVKNPTDGIIRITMVDEGDETEYLFPAGSSIPVDGHHFARVLREHSALIIDIESEG